MSKIRLVKILFILLLLFLKGWIDKNLKRKLVKINRGWIILFLKVFFVYLKSFFIFFGVFFGLEGLKMIFIIFDWLFMVII